MNSKPSLLTIVAVLATAAASGASAYPTNYRADAAEACARAVQADTGHSRFEVVKLNSHGGRGNFSIWLNAKDAQVGAFCRTRSGEVAQLFKQDDHWSRTRTVRPQTALPLVSEHRAPEAR